MGNREQDKQTSKHQDIDLNPDGMPQEETLSEWVKKKKKKNIRDYIHENHSADLAEQLSKLDLKDMIYIFRLCESEKQSEILMEFDEGFQEAIVNQLNMKEISPIVENLESDEMTSLISEISPEKAEEILNSIDKEESSLIRSQLNFDENTAGRLMTTDFAVVREDQSVRKGIISIRKTARETDNIYQMYVVNSLGVVTGVVQLKDLLLKPQSTIVGKIMEEPATTIHFKTDQEEVARIFRKYDLVSAPVVDDQGVMLGRITVDDILDIVEEEASEDILRLGGVSEDERLNTSIWDSVKRRITWLHINLLTALLASSVVAFFEDTIKTIVVLASLMPIVAGMGGNAGTQSITIVVRNIATGELTISNWFRAVRKELIIGVLNGLVIGFVTGVFVFLFKNNNMLAVVIGFAMFLNLIIAGLVGSLIPLILKRFSIDPAIASSIFVTTFTDVFGFFCFLGLASLFISYLV